MVIIAGDHVSLPAGDLLGNVGDDMLHVHKVVHPEIEGATFYLCVDYGEREVSMMIGDDGLVSIPATMLREAGEFPAQIWASKPFSEQVTRYWSSERFTVRIGTAMHW